MGSGSAAAAAAAAAADERLHLTPTPPLHLISSNPPQGQDFVPLWGVDELLEHWGWQVCVLASRQLAL